MTGKAIVLGSGTSNGVPSPGKQYALGYLASPKNHRTRPSLLLQGPGGKVLVDCTPEMRLQLLREGVNQIDAVIVTHTHADHVMGMDDLRSFSMASGGEMPVYSSSAYLNDIKRLFPYAFEEFPPGIFVPRFDLREVTEELDLCGMRVSTFWVDHGKVRVLGLRVGDFAYLTDVGNIPDEARSKLENLDTLILDAVRIRPHPNHFHFEAAIEESRKIGAKTTYFTHLCDDYDHHTTESGLDGSIRLAYDGLQVPF